MSRSLVRPVYWLEPCAKLIEVPASCTPSPTCVGLVPPLTPAGAPAPEMVWLRVSSNTVEELLYPAVLTLAMLLEVTSSICWWARRPEMPVNSERSMGFLLQRMFGNQDR